MNMVMLLSFSSRCCMRAPLHMLNKRLTLAWQRRRCRRRHGCRCCCHRRRKRRRRCAALPGACNDEGANRKDGDRGIDQGHALEEAAQLGQDGGEKPVLKGHLPGAPLRERQRAADGVQQRKNAAQAPCSRKWIRPGGKVAGERHVAALRRDVQAQNRARRLGCT